MLPILRARFICQANQFILKFIGSHIMKKLILAIIAILSIAPVYADGRHGGGHGGGRGDWGRGGGWGWGNNWIVPALIGGAVVYDLTRPQTIYVQPAPIYVQPDVVYVQTAPVYASGHEIRTVTPSASYWYFCPAANGYYPYVSSCPSGWQTVPATPPTSSVGDQYDYPLR
jgi:hypothetical protein